MKNESLGIPGNGFEYIKISKNKNGANALETRINDFMEITDFLKEVVFEKGVPEFQGQNKRLRFINYGDTQLVYVLEVNDRSYTLLLGQPASEFGIVKREHDNLRKLAKCSSENVVAPIHYFQSKDGKRELYVTPYLHQARCIASDDVEGWGVYVPEPEYHFSSFSEDERNVINSSMIALLVKMYDQKNKQGIAACKIGGGDFILEKGYEDEKLTHENILKKMKLIAARDMVSMSLEEYLDTLRNEFSKRTYYKTEAQRDKSILVNHKARVPMSQEEIEKGIEIGLNLREKANFLQK